MPIFQNASDNPGHKYLPFFKTLQSIHLSGLLSFCINVSAHFIMNKNKAKNEEPKVLLMQDEDGKLKPIAREQDGKLKTVVPKKENVDRFLMMTPTAMLLLATYTQKSTLHIKFRYLLKTFQPS
jgi:hypothetical protein